MTCKKRLHVCVLNRFCFYVTRMFLLETEIHVFRELYAFSVKSIYVLSEHLAHLEKHGPRPRAKGAGPRARPKGPARAHGPGPSQLLGGFVTDRLRPEYCYAVLL